MQVTLVFLQCVRTVDTDMVVIAVASFSKTAAELWVAFGVGSKFRYVHSHSHYGGCYGSNALPVFHAFTGCDTVSAFAHMPHT